MALSMSCFPASFWARPHFPIPHSTPRGGGAGPCRSNHVVARLLGPERAGVPISDAADDAQLGDYPAARQGETQAGARRWLGPPQGVIQAWRLRAVEAKDEAHFGSPSEAPHSTSGGGQGLRGGGVGEE